MSRTILAGMVSVALLVGAGFPASTQGGTVSEDVLFEIVVPARAVPDPLRKLYFEAQTIEPGAVGSVGAAAENMTGKAIYVDAGALLVEPVTDAFVWRQESTVGAEPEDALAGVPVLLDAGALILLPTIPESEALGDAELRVANPGTEMAVTYGFHLCGGGGSPAWPKGMGHIPPAGGVSLPGDDVAALASEDALVRLTRTAVEPDATVGLDDDVLFGLFRLETGTIDASFTAKTGGTTRTRSWQPGRGLPFLLGTNWQLRASSDVPASVLSLTGVELPSSAE